MKLSTSITASLLLSLFNITYTYDQITIENDTKKPIALGLYYTKNDHKALELNENSEYIPYKDGVIALEENQMYILFPGGVIKMEIHDYSTRKNLDLWFTFDLLKLPMALRMGKRNSVPFYSIKRRRTSVYLGEDSKKDTKAFSTRDEALKSSNLTLKELNQIRSQENINYEFIENINILDNNNKTIRKIMNINQPTIGITDSKV